MKKALITGITGQDGSYLTEFLLNKGYEVHGIIRRSSSINTWRIDHLINDKNILNKTLFLHYGDSTDTTSLYSIIMEIMPDEIYNLAAQSQVKLSFEIPEITAQINAIGTLRLLEIIKKLRNVKKIKLYQASTSELYGDIKKFPQNEETPLSPRSPYGVSKLYSYWSVKIYREAYNLFACNGILFNHESERRGFDFVTRKISLGLSNIKLGKQDVLLLGNLNSKRDWGYAKEYVEAMWLMLQQNKPDDYVIATGESHSVREFIEISCQELNIPLKWEGEGINERGVDKKTGKTIIKIDEKYFRPCEVDYLVGDYSKAKKILGWEPKIKFKDLVKLMVKADFDLVKNNNKILF